MRNWISGEKKNTVLFYIWKKYSKMYMRLSRRAKTQNLVHFIIFNVLPFLSIYTHWLLDRPIYEIFIAIVNNTANKIHRALIMMIYQYMKAILLLNIQQRWVIILSKCDVKFKQLKKLLHHM